MNLTEVKIAFELLYDQSISQKFDWIKVEMNLNEVKNTLEIISDQQM